MTLIDTAPRELAHRRNDGLDVQLEWHPADDRVTVSLTDARSGEAFELEVLPGERALDVFEHPFAYASRGRGTRRPAQSPLAA